MKTIMFWMLIVSSAGLLLVALRHITSRRSVFRQRTSWRWLGAFALNVAAGGLVLYFLALAEPYTHFHLPVNATTLATIGVLGLPGLAALVGLKLLVVG